VSRVETRGVELYYETEGEGPPVVFVGDAGLGAWQWGWQHRAVAGPYRTLVYDHRGVGRSTGVDADQSVPALVGDLRAVLGAASVGRPHLVGAGLGGLVALSYACGHGARSLVLLGATPGGGHAESTLPPAAERPAVCAPPDDADAVRSSLSALLSPEFRASHPDVVDGIVEWRCDEDAPSGACERQQAAMDEVVPSELHAVTVPALVVHGDADRAVPAADGRLLADSLPRGEYVGFDGAGHLVGVERSRPVNDRLLAHLETAGGDG
jgi:pimeloyl-ACP methyl ester carboxylesterase